MNRASAMIDRTLALLEPLLSRCTQIADLPRVGQFPTLKSQTKPLQMGVKSRTVCAAPPAALLTMAVLGTFPCTPLPLCQQADQGSRVEASH